MDNYLPITEPGTVRIRATRVEMFNKYGETPYIVWDREKQILLTDGSFVYSPETAFTTFADTDNLEGVFPLIDPDTGVQYGEMQGKELLGAVQSYFMHKDAQQKVASGEV